MNNTSRSHKSCVTLDKGSKTITVVVPDFQPTTSYGDQFGDVSHDLGVTTKTNNGVTTKTMDTEDVSDAGARGTTQDGRLSASHSASQASGSQASKMAAQEAMPSTTGNGNGLIHQQHPGESGSCCV